MGFTAGERSVHMKGFRLISVITTLVLCSALSGCIAYSADSKPKIEVSSYFEKNIELEQIPEFYLQAGSGNIEVYTWDRYEIKVGVKQKIRGTVEKSILEKWLKNFTFEYTIDENRITLISDYKGSVKNPEDACVYLTLYIPKKTRYMNYKLGAGNIKIHDDIKGILLMDIGDAGVCINRFEGLAQINARMGNISIGGGRLTGESSVITNTGNIYIKTALDEDGMFVFQTDIGNIELHLPPDNKVGFEAFGLVENNAFESSENPVKAKVRSNLGKISISAYEKF